MRFSHSFEVPAADIDEQGHVNNVAYLRWIQDVAVAHWKHAATVAMKEEYSWIVVRHEIDYKKPAFLSDEINIVTWIGEWTQVTCERFTEIRRSNDLLTKSRTLWCLIDKKTAKPSRIQPELIQLFL